MKTIAITILAFILASCSKKAEDFVGVYNFRVMDDYIVQDTTELVNSLYGQSPLTLKVKKLIPFKIDLFKSGDETKGTLTITEYQVQKAFNTINQETERKVDFKNIHLVNDTLLLEIAGRKKALEYKLTKSGKDVLLVVKTTEKDVEKEGCNQLATINGVTITYKALSESDNEEMIKQSNDCEVDKTVARYIEKGYKSEKKDYLKKLLSVELPK